MGINVTRIRDSVETIRCNQSRLRRRLLVNLVRQHPEMRSYFATEAREKISELFEAGVDAVLDNFEDPNVAEERLAEIIDRLPPLDFPPSVRQALPEIILMTVAETFGPGWDTELAVVWSEALGSLAIIAEPVQ